MQNLQTIKNKFCSTPASYILASFLLVRVCGFAGLRVCGFAGLRVCGFAGLRVCGFAGLRVCGFAGLRVCGFAGLRVCGFAGLRVCGFAGLRVCGFAGCLVLVPHLEKEKWIPLSKNSTPVEHTSGQEQKKSKRFHEWKQKKSVVKKPFWPRWS